MRAASPLLPPSSRRPRTTTVARVAAAGVEWKRAADVTADVPPALEFRMARLAGSALLMLLSLFMLVGFLRSDASLMAPASVVALLLTVGLPAAGGLALAAGQMRGRGRLARRREELRRQTIESEILRLAEQRGGRLTAVEVASDMAISPEAAKEALDSLTLRELAEIEITESGLIVYGFRDVRHLGEKPHAKGVLDA